MWISATSGGDGSRMSPTRNWSRFSVSRSSVCGMRASIRCRYLVLTSDSAEHLVRKCNLSSVSPRSQREQMSPSICFMRFFTVASG